MPNITTDNCVEYLLCLSDDLSEATSCSNAYMNLVTPWQESKIYGNTSNDQVWFNVAYSSAWVNFNLGWWQSAVSSSRNLSHRVYYIYHYLIYCLRVINQSQFGRWVPETFAQLWFLNQYISVLCNMYVSLAIKSNKFNRCLSIMTCAPVLTEWRRHRSTLRFNAGTIFTLQQLSTNSLLPIYSKMYTAPSFYVFNKVRNSLSSTTHHNGYIISQKSILAYSAEGSTYHHSEMHQ